MGGLAVVAFNFSTPAQNTGDQPDPNESFVPRPDSVPLAVGGDLEISADEAREWAVRSDFDFKLPLETHGLTLQSIVPFGIGPKARDNPELRVGEIRVLFARQPISRYTLEEFVADGGFMLLVQKRLASFENYVEQHRDDQIVTSVNGNLAIYEPPFPLEPEPIIRFTWVDGNSKFQLVASADHFSMEDLVSIAESVPNQNADVLSTPLIVDVFGGETVSLAEASARAEASGFRFEAPQHLPPGYVIKDITLDRSQLELGRVTIYFAPSSLDDFNKPSEYWEKGVIVLTMQRAQPDFAESARKNLAINGPDVRVLAEEIQINGEFALHNPGWPHDDPGPTRILVWVDGNTQFNLAANNELFSLEEMLKIAESIRG